MTEPMRALRGRVLSFGPPPQPGAADVPHRFLDDGVILLRDGRIERVEAAATLLPDLPPGTPVDHYPDALILPGLIDPHIHYPQTRVVGAHGTQLLEWLHRYTFPEEAKLRDPDYAAVCARFFLDELLRQGTTTAAVYCTVHPQSVDAFFAESARRNTRMIAGKVMMDRNAPDDLRDTAEAGARESAALLAAWHGRGRQLYAVTPRFAVTSTEAQLAAAGALLRDHPGVYMQTHLAENHAEIATVRAQFPAARSYTDVYARHGLLGPRSLFGHCLHLDDADVALLGESGSVAVFCPTSNLFLGSGLFDMARLRGAAAPVPVAIATDIGGGTSYSMLRTAAEGYKVLQMQGQTWPPLAAFRQITRGNAEALSLDDRIGAIEPGFEADFAVLDPRATPAMAQRLDRDGSDLVDELSVLLTLGDDRCVRATYVAGVRVAGVGQDR